MPRAQKPPLRPDRKEIRARAAAFAKKWKDAADEKGETHSFYDDFFYIFGVQRRRVARYEARVKKLDGSQGYIDLFWPGKLIVEQKSAGGDLVKAYEQAVEYFDALPEHKRPRYILVSDFQNFELRDLDAPAAVKFALADLPKHVEKFGFIIGAGARRRTFEDQPQANIKAAELVGRLHDQLADAGHRGDNLERLLVRIVFCLFADDTGIFERGVFLELVEDSANLGERLSHLFEVLDTEPEERPKTLDKALDAFPYVNGRLFEDALRTPAFSPAMRAALLDACRFDWSNISPAIFGALFQSVMDKEARRAQGAHYTTEANILKVINPLFMDDLRAEFERITALRRGRLAALQQFKKKLGELTFFDPACGCDNFLIIAYRELRELEIAASREIRDATDMSDQAEIDISWHSAVDVDQFYGIELDEFAARIAETALWMMDHLMNERLSDEFGQKFDRIPLKKSPHIVHGDALEKDWAELLPPDKCSFVLGNPPFGGFVYRSEEKQAQTKALTRRLGASGSRLDYVAAWFLKAGEYFKGRRARIGFVATNSITQGEQVAQLWPALFERYGLEIAFAHRTFAWGSDARGKARVHVVIIGLSDRDTVSARRLFSYDTNSDEAQESIVAAISPYLIDAGHLNDRHLVIKRQRTALNGLPRIKVGTKPVDGGLYLFNEEKLNAFLAEEPQAEQLFRPFLGGDEYINDKKRWILHVSEQSPALLRKMPHVMKRVEEVRKWRTNEAGKLGQSMADNPRSYHVSLIPDAPFLVIPDASSERRQYLPIGWLEPPTIPSDQLWVVRDAELWLFALLTSAMHMAWLSHIGGRLESRYRYSGGIVYNTFPTPKGADLSKLEPLAQAVLDARAAHPDATLADLYDPNAMPPNLRDAHQKIDRAVDRLYRRKAFASERERVEHLFMLYEKMCEPLTAAAKRPRARKRPRR